MGSDFPILPILIFIGALTVAFFARPSGGTAATPSAEASTPGAAPGFGSAPSGPAGAHSTLSSDLGPTGIATALYLLGVLALLLGGFIFAFSATSPHEILATLIGLMGAIFFAAGAVVTELQRIKKQLQADAARLAANNPQP